MNKKDLNKYLVLFGKIIAGCTAVLSIIHILPPNGLLTWSFILAAIFLILLGNRV